MTQEDSKTIIYLLKRIELHARYVAHDVLSEKLYRKYKKEVEKLDKEREG